MKTATNNIAAPSIRQIIKHLVYGTPLAAGSSQYMPEHADIEYPTLYRQSPKATQPAPAIMKEACEDADYCATF